MRILIIIAAMLLLSACATSAKIMVPIKAPSIKLAPPPKLDIYTLNKNSTPQEVMKAYVLSVYKQQQYIKYTQLTCSASR